jgi:tRNA threonylcarbamoyladenosine biosynthesis protein TsaB
MPAPDCRATGLLAFDTATETLAIAAAGPAGHVHWCGPGGMAASAGLLPQVRSVIAAAGLSLHDLGAIAFGAGPGAFTGLRTACAAAQGLAFGLGIPVLPLDSLAIVAEDSVWRDGLVWVAMDARMDEVYAAAYRWQHGSWVAEQAPALYSVAALAAHWKQSPPDQVAGSALAVFGGRLPVGVARQQRQESNRAAALLRCAQHALAGGSAVDPALALPAYVRDKVAFTTTERAAIAAAKAAA